MLLRHAGVFQGFDGLHVINEGGPSSPGSQNSGRKEGRKEHIYLTKRQ